MIERKPVRSIQYGVAIAKLADTPKLSEFGPVAARFLYSLRLIALYDRANRDPIPELAVRLSSVETADKALALAKVVTTNWPENLQISRFCCQFLTHDEATIGALVDAAAAGDRGQFDAQIDGLVRPNRKEPLWDAVIDLVGAEMRAA